MPYVLSEWFLLEIEQYIAQLRAYLALKNLRHSIKHFLYLLQQLYLSLTSTSFWRLIFLVLKRIIGVIKAGLKYFLIELPVPALEFLYILHFARAFLSLIDFFQDKNNKNLVEISKFLYACFKVFISLLMISFLIMLLIHGMAPLGLMAYESIKTLFRIYPFLRLGISLLTVGFSYYQTKSYSDDVEHAWLQAHYQANLQKHTHILVLGTLITALLTVASVFGMGLGPVGLAVVILLAGVLLLLDIVKAIYFYKNPCHIPELSVGSLAQQNSLIDFSTRDYYYRKCRTARLIKIKNPEDTQANKIYLIKEIVLAIILLEDKLKNCSSSSYNFFSEKPKIQKKILGLKQAGSLLLSENYEKNQLLFKGIIESLEKDYREIKENKTLIKKDRIENFLNALKESNRSKNNEVTLLDELLHARDGINKPEAFNSQEFGQSFFNNLANCKDIDDACQAQKQMEDETKFNHPLTSPSLRS